jgi:hypothetical protein
MDCSDLQARENGTRDSELATPPKTEASYGVQAVVRMRSNTIEERDQALTITVIYDRTFHERRHISSL